MSRKLDTVTLRAIRRLLGCVACAAPFLGVAPARFRAVILCQE